MKPSSLALLCIGMCSLVVSCQHEPSMRSSSFLTASVAGRVFDEAGLPLSNAQIQVEGNNATSDVNGNFSINNLQLNKEREVVSIIKSGYYTGTRTLTPTANSTNNIELKLIKKNVAGNFSATTGGVVNLSAGASINFPANSLVNAATSSPYTGTATVSAFFLDPTVSDFQKIMPGDLRGLDANDKPVGLQSLGMMITEIDGASGEKLQLATGKQATITFPIPAALMSQAQATIPLWYFDENVGLWKQDGLANKSGNTYVGMVSHFTWWNCDYPYNMVNFTATIKDQQDHRLAQADVRVIASNGSVHGMTGSDGTVAGKIPANQPLKMVITGTCSADTLNFGPFSNDHDFGIIKSKASDGMIDVSISGHVLNCSGNAVANGFVNLSLDGHTYRASTSSGNFNINLQRCNNAWTSAQLTGYDIDGNKQSNPLNLNVTSGNINAGNLTACSTPDEYINFSIDGTLYMIVPPYDSVDAQVYGMQTQVFAFSFDSTQSRDFDLGFLGNTPGNYPIDLLKLNAANHLYVKPDATQINVVVTEFGNIYQYISGSLSGYVRDSTAHTTVPVNCTFHVKRDL